MDNFIEWQPSWELGIDTVDQQHLQLVLFLNELARERLDCEVWLGEEADISDLPCIQALLACLNRLGEETREHFHHEEMLMSLSHYPGFGEHRREHLTLLAEFAALLRDIRQRGLDELDQPTLVALKQWLIGHMVTTDRSFARHYRQWCRSAQVDEPLARREGGVPAVAPVQYP